tara:strand:+ start:1010 stop:1207 length:198 start_codon:yes stop_codon:yes gene_type:complete
MNFRTVTLEDTEDQWFETFEQAVKATEPFFDDDEAVPTIIFNDRDKPICMYHQDHGFNGGWVYYN